MKQEVTFAMIPTTNPNEAISYARYVVNASSGIGMDLLKQIIEEHIPVVNNDQAVTRKEIIRTDRYECPCCNTSLTALVRVVCEGRVTDEWDKVNGLYSVSIDPDHGDCKVTIDKLFGTTIYQGRSGYLPKKDYNANPKVRREIRNRNIAIAKMIRKNPDKMFSVSGIETGEDLKNLVETIVKKFSDQKK